MRHLWLAILFVLAFVLPARAQQPNQAVVNVAFKVAASHDGGNTTGYRLYIDGAKVQDVSAAQLAQGTITFAAAPLTTRGTHTAQIGAYNQDQETKSDVLSFPVVLAAPSKPGTIIITITVSL